MSASRSEVLRHPALLLTALLVTVASAATWLLAQLACNLSEGQAPGAMDALCGGSGTPGRVHLALAATVVVPASYVLARRLDRVAVFAVGAAAGALACASVWLWG